MQKQVETYQFSNYQKIHALISSEEMGELLGELQPQIFPIGAVIQEGRVPIEDFVTHYSNYLLAIQEKKEDLFSFRPLLQVAFCQKEEDLRKMEMPAGILYKPNEPVILVRLCFISKDKQEKMVHPMVFGSGSSPWGLQFSYPAIVQEKSTGNILKGREFPNFSLFSTLQKWMRKKTKPASFFFGDFELKTPLRLGSVEFAKAHHI